MIAEGLQLNQRFTVQQEAKIKQDWLADMLWDVSCQIPEAQFEHARDIVREHQVLRHAVGRSEVITNLLSHVDEPTQWLTKAGKLPKRIAKAFHELYDIKLEPKLVADLGERIRRHLQENTVCYGDTTTEFDWDAGDFGDRGSCYWGSNEAAKDMIRDADGFAVRLFTDDSYQQGMARCWCIPDGEAYYIFNCYPKSLRLETFEAILLELLPGWQSKEVELSNFGMQSSTLYINSGSGRAIFPAGTTVPDTHDFYIEDTSAYAHCSGCGCDLGEDDVYNSPGGDAYCESCFNENWTYCYHCGEAINNDDVVVCNDKWMCASCAESHGYRQCYECSEWHREDEGYWADNEWYCADCGEGITECHECGCSIDISGSLADVYEGKQWKDEYYCPDCYKEREEHACSQCDEQREEDTNFMIDGKPVCQSCWNEYVARKDGYIQEKLEV